MRNHDYQKSASDGLAWSGPKSHLHSNIRLQFSELLEIRVEMVEGRHGGRTRRVVKLGDGEISVLHIASLYKSVAGHLLRTRQVQVYGSDGSTVGGIQVRR
jgi:hypothetical protein